jgi:hypothetical protein
MSEHLTTKEVIHVLERDHGFKIYKRKSKYSVWRYGRCWNLSNDQKDLTEAREIHKLYDIFHLGRKEHYDIHAVNFKKREQKSRHIFKDKRKWDGIDEIETD